MSLNWADVDIANNYQLNKAKTDTPTSTGNEEDKKDGGENGGENEEQTT